MAILSRTQGVKVAQGTVKYVISFSLQPEMLPISYFVRNHHLSFQNNIWKCRLQWASCQIRKIASCVCPGNAGTFSSPPRVSNPDMHHGTCVTHVLWCMPGSLIITSGFNWSQWRGKRYRHSRRMRNPQFYVSGKKSMCRPLCSGIFNMLSTYIFIPRWYRAWI